MTFRRALLFFLTAAWLCSVAVGWRASAVPPTSPATGLANEWYSWRNEEFRIRYQCSGPVDGEPLLLVHGLFVNADHWRKALTELGGNRDQGPTYRVYAVDLFGCGYSDKPPRDSPEAQRVNGENGRFKEGSPSTVSPGILPDVSLGTANGQDVRVRNVDLRHPLQSPYNFFTWSELLSDFTRDVIREDVAKEKQVTLVCNSIGTISAFQAVLDNPDLFSGVFVVCPNFRELHSAEIAVPTLSMPVVRQVQSLLREYGQGAFDFLATPSTVTEILKEPYAVTDAVDETLVEVLLNPLLTPGASQVVFDTLSYSAGPLPEQQLQVFPPNKPVWVCYGSEDPWTPGPRVESLTKFGTAVERVIRLQGIGHCPHDEAPELVHPLLEEFVARLLK